MRRALLLDTETTGIDPAAHVTIEVAAAVFDLELGVPLASFASLIHATRNEAEAVNAIPVAALVDAPPADVVWSQVRSLVAKSDVIVAHNASFDAGFVPGDIRDGLPWVCSKHDLVWPKAATGTSLVALALAHGLGVAHAHRALSDVDTLGRLFSRVHETGGDLVAMMAHGLRPKAKFAAQVSYDDREKAKSAGFQWEAASKRWLRTMAIEDAEALPFRCVRVA